jgi:phage tail-like protein
MSVSIQDALADAASQMGSSRGTTSDEAKLGLACRFDVTIHGHDLGGWAECSDLSVKFDDLKVEELGNNGFVRRLPGKRTYTPIRLKRAMTSGTWQNTVAWLAEVQQLPQETQTASITLRDAWGNVVANWSLRGVYPLKWTGPGMSASDQKVAIETLELAHDGFLPETQSDREPDRAILYRKGGRFVFFDYNPQKLRKRQQSRRTATGSNQKGIGETSSSKRIADQKGGSSHGRPVFSQSAAHHDVGCSEYHLNGVVFDGEFVHNDVDQLFSWMEATEEEGKPPTLIFRWGDPKYHYFKCTITSCDTEYVKFRADGKPIRAKVDLVLSEVAHQKKGTNPTSGGPGGHRTRVLALGDSLASVAFEEYGDPGLWRSLGRFNEVDDPGRLLPGTPLRIPTRNSLDRG